MNQKLIDEIQIDLDSMLIIANDVEYLINDVGTNLPNNIQKTALGGFASQFYNGVENIFKRIHKHYKIDLPKGENWHLVLISNFSNDSNIEFPIKLSNDLIEKISNYRRFRHYFFHGYSHNLNWDILKSGVEDINDVYNQLINELKILN
jgi:hypothetical protein